MLQHTKFKYAYSIHFLLHLSAKSITLTKIPMASVECTHGIYKLCRIYCHNNALNKKVSGKRPRVQSMPQASLFRRSIYI